MSGKLEITDLYKSYHHHGRSLEVLSCISMSVHEGEFISVVGASGCGKSTLLRIIAGLEPDYEGHVMLDGQPVLRPSLDKGFVFQDHRLFPWLTVEQNIGYGIPDCLPGKKDTVSYFVNLVGLRNFEKALPGQLSGGMAQRAAIARALANRPKVLLLDEPFGALDAMTRISMQEELLKIWEQEKATIIMVTHDIDEAVYLGDRVFVLSSRPGRIKKESHLSLGRPRDRVSDNFTSEKRKIYHEFFSEVAIPFKYEI